MRAPCGRLRRVCQAGASANVWGYISRSSDAERAVAAAINRFGGVDVLVNNAGIQSFGDVLTTSEDTWGRTFGVKLKGHWLMSRSTVPEMLSAARAQS